MGWADGKPSGNMEIRGWCRLRDGTEPDPLVLLQMGDAFPPVTFDLGLFGWVPTIELTTYVRAQPAPGWLACRMSARLLADGWIDEDAELWDSEGHLVAQARQLAGYRVRTAAQADRQRGFIGANSAAGRALLSWRRGLMPFGYRCAPKRPMGDAQRSRSPTRVPWRRP